MPGWASPWGLAGFMLATASLLSASLVGEWLVTVMLGAGGLVAVFLGLRATGDERRSKDQAWLFLGGALSCVILVIAMFLPGVLNVRWAKDVAVARADPNERVVVPRDEPRAGGRVLAEDDWMDAATEAVRQNDLLVLVESVRAAPLADRGGGTYVLVHLEFANIGAETILFQGFDQEKNRPTLADSAGTSYAFVEQRRRVPATNEIQFNAPKRGGMELGVNKSQGYLLVFESPPTGFTAFKMTLPGSAWGQKGTYPFLLSKSF